MTATEQAGAVALAEDTEAQETASAPGPARPGWASASREWSDKLREPFDDEQVLAKPRLYCDACRKATGKVCSSHSKKKCEVCKQNISTAHVDLDFVGHAEVTDRLNAADPWWYWEPAYRDVDKDVLMAAVQTGDAEIVRLVMQNSPPLLDKHGGMWMLLTVHDDDGYEVTRLGYGDAEGKAGPNAVKEVIGDGIRNVALRGGVALQQWAKSDLAFAKAGTEEDGNGRKRRATTRRTAGEAAGAADTGEGGKAAGEGGKADSPAQLSPAQRLADLAAKLVREGSDEPTLKRRVYDPAKRSKLLNSDVESPWSDGKMPLTDVISSAKQRLAQEAEDAGAQLLVNQRDGTFQL